MRRTVSGLLALGLLGSATAMAANGDAPASDQQRAYPGQVREIERGVLITLTSGIQLRVKTSADHRRTTIERAAPGGSWGPKERIVSEEFFCGTVEAAASATGVALMVQCDEHSYAEDQAPTHSQAMVSTDEGLTWTTKTLPGEAYEEPAISPAGVAASWPLGSGQFMAWRAGRGFWVDEVNASRQEYTETTAITDSGDVTYVYGDNVNGSCGVTLVTVTTGGAETRQSIPFPTDVGCGDSRLYSTDANTVVYDDGYRHTRQPELEWVVRRPDVASPWVLTTIAPFTAPGLVKVERGRVNNEFLSTPGYPDGPPLVSLSARDRRHVIAQTYDAESQRWAAPVPIYTSPAKCSWVDDTVSTPAYIAQLECGRRKVALSSTDGLTWSAQAGLRAPLGIRSGQYVAVATSRQITLYSSERGRVTLPYGVSGRCDLVMPAGPDSAALLTTRPGHRSWPAKIRTSTPTGWDRGRRVKLPTPKEPCTRIEWDGYDGDTYQAVGRRYSGYTFSMLQSGGNWRIKRFPY